MSAVLVERSQTSGQLPKESCWASEELSQERCRQAQRPSKTYNESKEEEEEVLLRIGKLLRFERLSNIGKVVEHWESC